MPKIGCALGALLIVMFINTECAKLQYIKVPTATQYSNWDDAKQAKADGMEGQRQLNGPNSPNRTSRRSCIFLLPLCKL